MRLIAVGGVTQRLDAAAVARSGFDAGLTKPLTPSRLLDAIAACDAGVEPAAGAGPRPSDGPDAPPGARVLVVEDNAVNQFVVRRMLTARGYACDVAADGRLAVEAAGRQAYDVVLMDCSMPELDGFEATRRIRLAERHAGDGRRVPIVALTAGAFDGDRAKCLAAGMDDYVTKPIDPARLLTTIRHWVQAARGHSTGGA